VAIDCRAFTGDYAPTMPNQLPANHNPSPNQPPANHTGGAGMVSLAEAALTLGITVNALRQRIKRGTVRAVKTEAGWLVATNRQPTASSRSTNYQPTTIETAGLAPLAAMVADLARDNRELAAAAAVWQERARVLEDRLLALSAGDSSGVSPRTRSEPQGDVLAGDVGVKSRWRRWVRALGG
jgi:hypothetical protein